LCLGPWGWAGIVVCAVGVAVTSCGQLDRDKALAKKELVRKGKLAGKHESLQYENGSSLC
jgi:hypothetical protein